jgi:hypothetical protein
LNQHTSTVTGFLVAANGTSMNEVFQNCRALPDNIVRGSTLNIRNEANATTVVFMKWLVKTMLGHCSPDINCAVPLHLYSSRTF